MTGETDTVVLALPEAAWPGLGGELLGALVAAGAFAAFLSTVVGPDGLGRRDALLRPPAALPARRRRTGGGGSGWPGCSA